MVNFKTGVGNVQDEPIAFSCVRNQKQAQNCECQKDMELKAPPSSARFRTT